MITFAGLFVLLIAAVLFSVLLIVALASRRFRGPAIGLLLMSFLGGCAFIALAFLMTSWRHMGVAELQYEGADWRQSGAAEEITHARTDVVRSGFIQDQDGPTGAEITHASDVTAIGFDTAESPDTESSQEGEAIKSNAAASSDEANPPQDEAQDAGAASVGSAAADDDSSDEDSSDNLTDEAVEPPHEPSSDGADDSRSSDAAADFATDPLSANGPVAIQVPRPDWLKWPAATVNRAPSEIVVSDAYVTGDECEANLDQRIRTAILRYASAESRKAGGPSQVYFAVGPHEIRMVSRERFLEIIPTSVGPMKQIHQRIVFDKNFQTHTKRQVAQTVVGRRLAGTGVVSGGVFLLVATAFGLFKISSRLQKDD